MDEIVKSNNKICGRLCVEMTGRLDSPLSIGSGEENDTDSDIVFHASGEPYIPGSSLAGALLEYAAAMKGEKEAKELFGMPMGGEPGGRDDRQSRIFVYDASIEGAKIGIRDGVKLDETKTASNMGKYELQFVERGANIRMRIEIIEREDCFKRIDSEEVESVWDRDLQWIHLWRNGFLRGELRLGGKSRRGFGKIAIDRIRIRKFDMRKPEFYEKWLDWDWENTDAFEGKLCREILIRDQDKFGKDRLEHCLEVPLRLSGTLLVRTYANAFAKSGEIADYWQMTVAGDENMAVIPGSSWAGAFRSHIAKILQELQQQPDWREAQKMLNPLFGTWTDTEAKTQKLCASRLIFEETVLAGGHGLPTARIAVDRFTGGTVQGALYEEVPWTGGELVLRIRWRQCGQETPDNLSDNQVCGMLLWAIRDLQAGLLAVGGETSVGRGIFGPGKDGGHILLDENTLTDEQQKQYMQDAALWAHSKKKPR